MFQFLECFWENDNFSIIQIPLKGTLQINMVNNVSFSLPYYQLKAISDLYKVYRYLLKKQPNACHNCHHSMIRYKCCRSSIPCHKKRAVLILHIAINHNYGPETQKLQLHNPSASIDRQQPTLEQHLLLLWPFMNYGHFDKYSKVTNTKNVATKC